MQNLSFRCKSTGAMLTYESCFGEHYRLRGTDRDLYLEGDNITLGRKGDLVVNHPGLSRLHCRFVFLEESYAVEDLGSRNGTFVNEERLAEGERRTLMAGDLVRLADNMFRYIEPESSGRDSGTDLDRKAIEAEGLESLDSDVILREDRLIGKTLGSYLLKSVISQGGMGRVYQAEEVGGGRACVVKTIVPGGKQSQELIQRFIQEMGVSLDIRHPNIIEFYDAGQVGNALYIAMEYFPGRKLGGVFRHRTAEPAEAVRIGRQVASALAVAHARGVIHRDIKPENLLMDEEGTVKVLDFGIAKVLADPGYSSITLSGAVVGTLRYMSPEQVEGKREFTATVDIFALGAVLYAILAGRPPFSARNIVALAKEMRRGAAPLREIRPDVPLMLAQVIETAMASKPSERFQSAEAMEKALAAIETE